MDENGVGLMRLRMPSPFDGSEHVLLVEAPTAVGPRPLIISPHPCTWTAEENYGTGPAGIKWTHPGWAGVAERYGAIVVCPAGHGRRSATVSMGWEGQIADLAAIPDFLASQGFQIDRHRVYACGLSMGGLESLLLAAFHPHLLAAVFAFNPVVDPVAWYEDLRDNAPPDLRLERIDHQIALEIGGTPEEQPAAWGRRNPLRHVDALTTTPIMLYWSDRDAVVPRQRTHHAVALYRRVKALDPNAPIAEYNHTRSHGLAEFTPEIDWGLHEFADYDLATRWLISHRRP